MTTRREIRAALRTLEQEGRALAGEIKQATRYTLAERVKWEATGGSRAILDRFEEILADAKADYEKVQFAIANLKLQLTKQKQGWYWK